MKVLLDSHILFWAMGEEEKLPTLKIDDGVDHKDPFDRMLICQAKAEGMTFITHDSKLSAYHEDCIEII